MKRACITLTAFMAVFLCLNSNATLLYSNSFEYSTPFVSGTTYRWPWPRSTQPDMWYNGPCHRTEAGDSFDSIAVSTKRAAAGSKSMRVISRTDAPKLPGHCPFSYLYEEPKTRNEMIFGWGATPEYDWGVLEHGEGPQWYAWEMYIPSNEGNYSSWVNGGWAESIVFQFFAAGAGADSPELHGMLGKNLQLRIEHSHSTNANDEILTLTNYRKNLLPDRWNQFVIYYDRHWSTGQFKIWINPDNWSTASASPTFTKTRRNL